MMDLQLHLSIAISCLIPSHWSRKSPRMLKWLDLRMFATNHPSQKPSVLADLCSSMSRADGRLHKVVSLMDASALSGRPMMTPKTQEILTKYVDFHYFGVSLNKILSVVSSLSYPLLALFALVALFRILSTKFCAKDS